MSDKGQLIDDENRLPFAEADMNAVLDMLIPANGGWPGAGELNILRQILIDAEIDDERDGLINILSLIPSGFVSLSKNKKVSMLKSLESNQQQLFSLLLKHVFNIYYSDIRVLKIVEKETAYPARPPLYGGYVMEPFDESLVKKQRSKKRIWRSVKSAT